VRFFGWIVAILAMLAIAGQIIGKLYPPQPPSPQDMIVRDFVARQRCIAKLVDYMRATRSDPEAAAAQVCDATRETTDYY
jgi:hypothetical protein